MHSLEEFPDWRVLLLLFFVSFFFCVALSFSCDSAPMGAVAPRSFCWLLVGRTDRLHGVIWTNLTSFFVDIWYEYGIH